MTSYGVSIKQGPLSLPSLKSVLFPNLSHSNADIRAGASKILIEVHKRTGGIVSEDFLKELPQNIKQSMLQKLEGV
ncbi:hypothetical protein COB52_04280 [Candidatus Kaiserbacteria bacterium]|nr:MAG: hypothetical protein COB52_04280 [Candidatus Kaiserbacteria bacterium]